MSKEHGIDCQDVSSTTWNMNLLPTQPKLLNIVSDLGKKVLETLQLPLDDKEAETSLSVTVRMQRVVENFLAFQEEKISPVVFTHSPRARSDDTGFFPPDNFGILPVTTVIHSKRKLLHGKNSGAPSLENGWSAQYRGC
jgi:hypothetical protein